MEVLSPNEWKKQSSAHKENPWCIVSVAAYANYKTKAIKDKISAEIKQLSERKEEILENYVNENDEMQTMLSAQNMEIQMNIKFLQSLLQ